MKKNRELDSEDNSNKQTTQMPIYAKTIIVISALIMIAGSVFLWILLATFTGVGIGLSLDRLLGVLS